MKLSEWLEDDRGFGERVALVDALLTALAAFHDNEPGARPALDPESVVVEGGNCQIEPAGRRLDPAGASYRAPETNEGAPYAPSADTFSAGVLSYQILSGRHPFLMETARGKLEAAGNVPATPLREVQPEVPRDLGDAVMACLERDPEWRAKDISYLAEVVKRSRPAGKPGRAPARKTAAPEPRVSSTRAGGAAPSFGALQPRTKQAGSRLPLILGSIAGMLMLVGGLWYFTRPEPPPLASPRPTLAPIPTPSTATSPSPTPSTAVLAPTPAAKPTPGPSPTPTTIASAAAPLPTPIPTATPTVVSVPTPRPTPTSRPTVTETPTPPPAPSPSPVATATPAPANVPASISTVVPNKLKRPTTTLLDVRGSGLRPDHKGLVLKGRDVVPGVSVINQRFVNQGLVQVMVKIEDSAAPGTYQLLLVDAQGQATSPRPLEVTK